MPPPALYRLEIKQLNPEAISLSTVTRSPRLYNPQDVKAACQNMEICCPGAQPVASVLNLSRYLLMDFFALMHRTGLYNRQTTLWEALARVAAIDVWQQNSGIFIRKVLPVFDLHLLDSKNRVLVWARLAEPSFAGKKQGFPKLLSSLIRQGQSENTLHGLVLCLPSPFPELVLKKVRALTNAQDPVGRYESLLPKPLAVSIDLFEMDFGSAEETSPPEPSSLTVRLVHPDLTARRRAGAARSADHIP